MATIKNPLTLASIKNITAKYGVVKSSNVGDVMKHTIESVSNPFDVKNGAGELVSEYGNSDSILRKKIVTFKAISEVGHAYAAKLIAEAFAAEKAGDADAAHELYQEYLNKARFSTSILSTEPGFELDLQRGDRVSVEVEEYEGEKGNILRGTGKTLRVIAPVEAAKANLDSFFTSIEDSYVEPAPVIEPAKATAKA